PLRRVPRPHRRSTRHRGRSHARRNPPRGRPLADPGDMARAAPAALLPHRRLPRAAAEPAELLGQRERRAAPGPQALLRRRRSAKRGGFTREARYEAERSTIPIHVIAMQDLRRLLVGHYEKLDP